ncbi:hypothetical protein [Limobrevibacterium gyesilva]|uniref:Uncharacterized protein n=1 Tax=Limobrevibacterium gyesilva TaxID=2991712 RepID=A0AA41YR77_9PROT|nr:hypothetical protein [Limobrevibacterium gyesilva]MCW3477360.1 hypothetical protein [Limobrevibacterium gyesilva]
MSVKDGAPVIAANVPVTGVLVGTPMYGGQCYDSYLHGMLDLRAECLARGLPCHVMTTRNESDIVRARNHILAEFVASSCSHLVFIDSDIGFRGTDVLRLIAHGQDLVGATYAKKNPHAVDFAYVPLDRAPRLASGLVEVAALPGGFFCIRRDAVLEMTGAYRDLRYVKAPQELKGEPWEHHLYNLFGTMICPQSRTYWTEDYAFSRRWRDLGGKIWLDPAIILEHSGTSVFTGDPATSFTSVATAAQSPRRRKGGV